MSSVENEVDLSVKTPFIGKLRALTIECDPKYGVWSEDGQEFIVRSEEFEEKVLRKYFKGTLKTFVRQLHFYGFRKSEATISNWRFSHPKFHRDHPEWLLQIHRKTKFSRSLFCNREEYKQLKYEVKQLKKEMRESFDRVRADIASIFKILTEKSRCAVLDSGTGSTLSPPQGNSSPANVENRIRFQPVEQFYQYQPMVQPAYYKGEDFALLPNHSMVYNPGCWSGVLPTIHNNALELRKRKKSSKHKSKKQALGD